MEILNDGKKYFEEVLQVLNYRMSYFKVYLISVVEDGKRGNGEIIVFCSFVLINKYVSIQFKRFVKY